LPNHSEIQADDAERDVPFFPNVLLEEISLAIAVIGLLAVFVSLFPLKLGARFDPMNPPSVLEPEWYFMGFYQFLKTQGVEPVHGIVLMMGVGVFMVLIPFLDRGVERLPVKRPVFTAAAFVMIVEFLALTFYGYMFPGQVGSFSDSQFVVAFGTTTLVASILVLLVFASYRRAKKGV
jgi:quinol-cytochrome oxidoreductase complex cytochrome b subunit